MSTRTPTVQRPDGAAAQVVELPTGDGLSPRGRRLALVLTLVVVLVGLAVLSATAGPQLTGVSPTAGTGPSASPVTGPGTHPASPAGEVHDGAIQAEWDGPVVHLDWRGRTYASAAASFVGDRVASPGDRVQRTLRIANAGPSDAVMSVALVAQRTGDGEGPGEDLGEVVDLFWDAAGVVGRERFAALVATGDHGRVVSEVAVPHGATVPVTVGFTMPAHVSTHQGSVTSDVLEFQLVVRLQGDTAAAPQVPGLALTGAQVAVLVAVALALAALGGLLWLLARRRRREDCDAEVVDGAGCARCGPGADGAPLGHGPDDARP